MTRKSVVLATCEENWARINMNIPPFSENALALFFIQSTILQLLAGWGYIFLPFYHPSFLWLLPWDIPFCVGSSPQIGSTALAERIPAIVKIPIKNAVKIRSRVGDTAHDNASQISVANKAPAVPGANGEKPEPKPVAIIIWISGTLFILSVKCVQSYKNNITFPLVREKVISRIPSAWNFSFIGMEQKFR